MSRSILITAAIVSAFAAVGAQAGPTQTYSDEAVHVSVRSTDFSNPTAVHFAYARLKAAASRVCDSEGPIDIETAKADEACRANALSEAVAEVNQPALTAQASRDGIASRSELAVNDRAPRGSH